MKLKKNRHIIFLFASFLILSACTVFGKAQKCEAAVSPYSKIATPNTKTYYYIRKSANMNSAKVGKFAKGSGASILKTGTVWLKVKSGSVTGYIKKSLVLTGSKLEAYAKKNKFPKKIKINVRSLIVRQKASQSSASLTGVSKGQTYKMISETTKWAKIKANGITGYVLKKYVSCSYDLKTATPVSSTPTAPPNDTVSASPADYSKVALCIVSSLNVRESDTTSSRVIGHMDNKTSGNILSKGSSWTKIQSGTVIGYIKNDYYVSGSLVPTYAKKAGVSQKASLKSNMNVRASASTSSKIIGSAAKGSSYTIKKELSGWVMIAYGSKTGYLKKDYISISYDFAKASSADSTSPGNGTGEQIVSYALQFKGNPYVYGGTSLTNGCDCSGFTQSVYKHFGYTIPRVSRDQAQYGQQVSLSSIQKGDLVFYADASTGIINHVGIYIGNYQIIHSSNERLGIIISSYTHRTPAKVVRYIK